MKKPLNCPPSNSMKLLASLDYVSHAFPFYSPTMYWGSPSSSSLQSSSRSLSTRFSSTSKYEEYNNTIRGRKKKFQSLVKGLIDDKSISSLIEQVTYLDNNYRTPEVHKTGSMRTWVLTSQDLFLDKQLNLMNYFNWVLGYADWVDTVIADNEDKNG